MVILSMRHSILLLYLFEIFLTCGGNKEGDDLHSSVTALEKVLNTEKHLVKSLISYITSSEQKLKILKSFLTELKNEYFNLLQDGLGKGSTENPFLLFLLKKRLSINVPDMQKYWNIKTSKIIHNFTVTVEQNDLPTMKDLQGAALGLLRIQEVYDISAEQIVDGMMKDITFGAKFTASDCFEVGLKLNEFNYHFYAIQWYKLTLKRIEEEGWKGITPKIDKNSVLDYLAYSQYMEGSVENTRAAVETAISALRNNYTSPNAIHIVSNLKSYIEGYIELITGKRQPTEYNPPLGTLSRYNLTELDLLKRGCRGELKKSPAEERKLFCRYERKNHPFLLLAPIKVEVMNLEPLLVVLHDVMYDSEIEILKELSREKLTRAGIWNQAKGIGEASTVRTSKFAWFDNSTHPIFHTLNQRVSDMTGLTMETAEDFQLMNYGIGGHYDIHPDYFIEPTKDNGAKPYGQYQNGNRIATVLFYMSDISHGGGTTWPSIDILTVPKKRSAAFWYNLHADGQPDPRSRHSACPIITGSKWVINKWIRIRGQEFRRPCLIYRDSEW